MEPNYRKSADTAIDTIIKYGINPERPDPAMALRQMRNVVLIPYASDAEMIGENQDAFTLVNREGDALQYIIIYNKGLDDVPLRLALSRELGHIALGHDGNSPESVWMEEAVCFAYHFLCPLPLMRSYRARTVPVYFRPKRHCLSWEMKEARQFNSISDMKTFLVNERNTISRYVGSRVVDYKLDDIALLERCEYEQVTGWHNCYDVVLNGEIIGHCGE